MQFDRFMGAVVWCACALALVGIGCSSHGRVPTGGDAGPGHDSGIIEGCDSSADADGDGIADVAEGMDDLDGDGTPNYLDTDSDGDGISDMEEHAGAIPCSRPDTDGDGIPDWWDTDSDNDGLSDAEERMIGTNPYLVDTDGDGVSDLGEAHGTMTDPTDPTSTIDPNDFFVVLPYYGDHENRSLRFGTDISIADVYFLIDTTGSMGGPIANVRSSLSMIATEIGSRIADVQMGVGHFEDFPNAVDIFAFDGYGMAGEDKAYEHVQDITPDLASVQTGLNSLVTANGFDAAEAHVEALYQTATGMGGSWSFTTGAPVFTIPPRSCPSIPDERGGGAAIRASSGLAPDCRARDRRLLAQRGGRRRLHRHHARAAHVRRGGELRSARSARASSACAWTAAAVRTPRRWRDAPARWTARVRRWSTTRRAGPCRTASSKASPR